MTETQAQPTLYRTALYDSHKGHQAKLAPFGGWDMPIQYSSIQEEHSATRTQAGLFDLCHMGRLIVKGKDHKNFLDHLLTNNVHDLEVGRARYSLVLNEQGGILDDILIYADTDHTFVVVNASNREKILSHFKKHAKNFTVEIVDRTFDLAMIAIQGPRSVQIVNKIASLDVNEIAYYGYTHGTLSGKDASIARTGYTGEDGFELFTSTDHASFLWQELLSKGEEDGLRPVGLAARDTLRLEAGMPLYGHELDESINPLEAGLRWAVKLKKDPPFIGQAALQEAKNKGLQKKLVGLECLDKRVPRQGYPVKSHDQVIGEVVSGTASPTTKKNIAQAYVTTENAEVGTQLFIEIRGKNFPAVVVSRPFYKR